LAVFGQDRSTSSIDGSAHHPWTTAKELAKHIDPVNHENRIPKLLDLVPNERQKNYSDLPAPVLPADRAACFAGFHLGLARRRPSYSPPVGLAPNGVELKAERRKPSGEKPCDIEDTPSLTGVLAHFRLH
jgi:hypothetical protein